jgi:hypothetical protein
MKLHFRELSLALVLVIAFSGCKKKATNIDHGDTPPPVESIQPGRCADGGGVVADATSAAFFPRSVGDYCIDPNSETRAYGKNAPGTLDQVCTELFDGECEVYRMYGLERVVTVRYADGKGSTSTVNVVLSRFETPRGAFGFYTKRVVGVADPVVTKTKAIYVAELSYVNDSESPDALRLSAARALPDLAKSIGNSVPGDTGLPDTAGLLPVEDRVPMGIAYEPRDILGVQGVGSGSMGFYLTENRRYRVAMLERTDEASAQDVMRTLKKIVGAAELKTPMAVLTLPWHGANDAVKTEWLFARQGRIVVGIGDEELALTQLAAAQSKEKCLSHDQKLERLKKILDAVRNRPSTPTEPTAAAVQPASDSAGTKKE